MKKFIYLVLLGSLTLVSADAKSSAVRLTSSSFQEKVVVNSQGEEQLMLAPVSKIIPGDIVIYKNDIVNKGRKTASNLVIKNAIPKHMEYVEDSSLCLDEQGCRMLFSIDGGATFKNRDQLFSTNEQGEQEVADAKAITTIKWIIHRLKAGGHNQVQFKARLK